MVVKELNLDFVKANTGVSVVGRPEVLSKAVEGSWATTFKGRGLEFTGYRPYTFSDDASQIDWKATLRSKDTLLREFEEFKNFQVLFVLDTSDSMLFTSSYDKFKAEYAAEILYIVSQAAMKSGDAIGLSIFNNGIVSTIEPSFGAGMRSIFERELSINKYYGGVRNFKKSLLQIHSSLPDPTIVMIFSDFLGLPDDWGRYISVLSARHQVYGVMVVDERDLTIPKDSGQFFLKDPATGKSMYVDGSDVSKDYAIAASNHVEYVRNVFKKVRGDCLVLKNGEDPTRALQKFFNRQGHSLS